MRLTHLCEYADKRKNREPMIKIRNKLFELENIEDELGIDLVTLFKASKNGIYYSIDYADELEEGECSGSQLEIDYKNKCFVLEDIDFYFKDYGKTWALTKEELEK